MLRYLVMVQTGEVSDAGAQGGVTSVCLMGSKGNTGQQLLTRHLTPSTECMSRGSLDVYVMEAVSVGQINCVRLGFEGRGKGEVIYLRVRVR